MKSSVKRRLQIRFVLLALVALVILQGLIVAFSIFRKYQQITGKADYIIRLTSTPLRISLKPQVCGISSLTISRQIIHSAWTALTPR